MNANPDSVWVLVDGEAKGPFAPHELKEKGLSDETLCAHEGDAEWKPLKDVVAKETAATPSTSGIIAVLVMVVMIGLFIAGLGWAGAGSDNGRAAAEDYIKDQPGTTRIRKIESTHDGVYVAEVDYINAMGGPSRKTMVLEVKRGEVRELR